MSRLLIWRHGQTAWNSERRFQGQTDVELDATGIHQAASSAVGLARREPKLIISSDLQRASRTGQALVEVAGLPMELDPRLRERHFGPWQGLTATEISQQFPEYYGGWSVGAEIKYPGIETIEAMTERVTAAFRAAAERAGDAGTVVLATHGGTARVGIGSLLGWPPEIWPTLGVLGNCRVTELLRSPERGWQLVSHNAHVG